MALPNQGRIDMDGLIDEFNHPSNPAPIDHFYRGGSYVPSQIPGTPVPSVPGYCSPSGPTGNGTVSRDASQYPDPNCDYNSGLWKCSTGIGGYSYTVNTPNCRSSYGVTYTCKGSSTYFTGSGTHPGGPCNLAEVRWVPPVPAQPGTPVPINSGVPTSGRLALDNFYGAYNP